MNSRRAYLVSIAAMVLCASMVYAKPYKVAVFVPGVRAGNAIYEGMAKGVEKAVSEIPGALVKILDAGFNQAQWEEKLTSLVATGEYDLLVTSNPSMPELCVKVGASFPRQKFLCLDGQLAGNKQIYTVLYNQTEQGYVTGYLAGLASISTMPGANKDKKAGLIIGQHYPVMDKIIAPGFEQGLKAVDPAFTLDIRVVGNWFDAAKASDLAKSMFDSGVDVILPISGSANQGVIKLAQDSGKYIVIFDADDYARAPGTVLSCMVLHQEELAYVKTKAAAEGKLVYGTADLVGMKDGYIEFLDKNKLYIESVPAAIREKVAALLADIRSGKKVMSVPRL